MPGLSGTRVPGHLRTFATLPLEAHSHPVPSAVSLGNCWEPTELLPATYPVLQALDPLEHHRHTVRLDAHVYHRELPQLQARLDPCATESREIHKQLGAIPPLPYQTFCWGSHLTFAKPTN